MTNNLDQNLSRIGIFGGSFNPFHLGHLNSIQTVAKELSLDKVFVVPSYQTPGKKLIESPTPEQRLDILKLGLEDVGDIAEVDTQELDRKGVSYTVDTLSDYKKKYPNSELYLIVGADAFKQFTTWKNFEKILEFSSLVVTTRPGYLIPFRKEDYDRSWQDYIEEAHRDRALLKSGNEIVFITLRDKEVSGTDIRKFVRAGLQIDKFVTLKVENFIHQNDLYKPSEKHSIDFEELTRFCGDFMFENKGFNVKGFDLRKSNTLSDFALVVSGTSTRHVSSLGENFHQEAKRRFGITPISVEGVNEGRWVLLDYGGLIVHIFYDFVRTEYKLEEVWKSAVDMNLKDSSTPLVLRS